MLANNAGLRDLHERDRLSFQQIHNMDGFGRIGLVVLRRGYQETGKRATIEGKAVFDGDNPDLSEMAELAR